MQILMAYLALAIMVFFTDAHDLEMMLVKGGVVDKFIMTHTERKLIQGNLAEVFVAMLK